MVAGNGRSPQEPQIAQQVTFWDAGSPAYRWIELLSNRALIERPTTAYPHRVLAYMAMAMHDATIAAWDSKYAYNRPRPSQVDPALRMAVRIPQSPPYPSEYAATAAAAAAVLSYFLPQEAESFRQLAEEAEKSRLYAGTEFVDRTLRR